MTSSGVWIVFQQAATGQVSLVSLGGTLPLAFTEETFADIYLKHPEVAKTVFPLLRSLGIILPYEPTHPDVVQQALVRLRPTDAADVERTQALLKQLGDNTFSRREEASRLLSAGFCRWKDLIMTAESAEADLEAKTRLQQILEEHAQDELDKRDACIDALGVLEDPAFLVGLLGCSGVADRKAVSARLARVAGKDLGQDPGAWQEWLRQSVKKP
jgi:hypothetical protein